MLISHISYSTDSSANPIQSKPQPVGAFPPWLSKVAGCEKVDAAVVMLLCAMHDLDKKVAQELPETPPLRMLKWGVDLRYRHCRFGS